VVLVRDPGSPQAYDLGLFTLDAAADPADISLRRRLCPWYRTKTSPSAADMLARLRREFLHARISAVGPGQDHLDQIDADAWTCDTAAA